VVHMHVQGAEVHGFLCVAGQRGQGAVQGVQRLQLAQLLGRAASKLGHADLRAGEQQAAGEACRGGQHAAGRRGAGGGGEVQQPAAMLQTATKLQHAAGLAALPVEKTVRI